MKTKLLIILISIIIVLGCQKEHFVQNGVTNNTNLNALKEDNKDSTVCKVSFCNGVAVFSDTNEYLNAYSCLEQKHETWNIDFDNTHSTLTPLQMEDYIDSTGWDENYELHYFEKYYQINSYQSYLDSLEEIWLAGGTWNSSTDPDNLDFYDDEITNTFFNYNGMLLIGTSLLVIDYNGDLWVISNANCNTILSASQDPDILQNTVNSTKMFSSSSTYGTECPDYAKDITYSSYYADSHDRKLKMKIKYSATHFGGDGTNMKSKIKTYRKKNSHWKHCRRELYTEIQGQLTTDCEYYLSQGVPNGPKKRRSLKAKYEMAGYYYYYQATHLVGTYKDASCGFSTTLLK